LSATASGYCTNTVIVAEPNRPALFVAVTFTVNVPVRVYVWLTVSTAPLVICDVPSPKSHW
jgi:hypothetical protein